MEADCFSWGRLVKEWHLLPHIFQAAFQPLGQPKIDLLASSCTNQCQLYYTGVTITSRSLGVECIQPSMEVSGELCIFSSSINSSGVVQVSSGTWHKSIQTSYSCGNLLDRGSLGSQISQHVGGHSLSAPHCKGSCHRYFSRPCVSGPAIVAFNPLAAQR